MMPNFEKMEIVSLFIHNIAYFPPCLGRMYKRKDGEAGLKKNTFAHNQTIGASKTLYFDNFRPSNLHKDFYCSVAQPFFSKFGLKIFISRVTVKQVPIYA